MDKNFSELTENKINAQTKGGIVKSEMFCIRNDVASTYNTILNFPNGVAEVLCLYSRVENLMLIALYRQPDDKTHSSTSKEFKVALDELKKDILMRRFQLDWRSNQPKAGFDSEVKTMFELLTEFTNDLCMKQYVQGSTHKDGNTSDLFVTNNESLYNRNCNTVQTQC